MPYDFSKLPTLFEKAGLNASEMAPFFRVSRTTVYNWLNGTPPHQEVVRLFAERQIRVIEKALAAGDLPLKEVAQTDRKTVLAAVLRKHSQA